MKTKKRIRSLEYEITKLHEMICNLQQTVASLILRDFKLEVPVIKEEWKLKHPEEPTATGTPLYPPESITIK
jgi:hypothetical protein